MKSPVELWVYLSASPLIWLTMTLSTWISANALSRRLHRHPLANPVLVSILILSFCLWCLEVPYEKFFAGAQFVHFLLGPATVAIAVPLYLQRHLVLKLVAPISVALVVGTMTGALSAYLLGSAFGLPKEVLVSLLPKSATAGVAMAISSNLGGNPSLTAVLVVTTGIFGAIIVTPLMNAMKIRNYAARGFAVGLASHGIGTARAYEVDKTAGLFSGIAMALNALATSIIVPLLYAVLF